ncbi:AbiU2 domain-containing protein [Cupriavidus plantarum]|uniref:AbiU2 domain-containing protein n=1 Tax=Cupriavidus plantarum TaxID=942865 RepID=UPI000EAEAE2B
MFIELGCLFDTDSRAASMRNLKCALIACDRRDLVSRIDDALSGYKDLVSGVLTVRSKLIAHKDIDAKSEEVHAQANLVPNQMGRLIDVCSELISGINGELFGVGHMLAAVTDRFERATFELLKVVRKGRA